MKDKIVSYEIRVPVGNYCWKYSHDGDEHICQFFDNRGGHPSCDLGLYGQEKNSDGVVKADRCLHFQEVQNEG